MPISPHALTALSELEEAFDQEFSTVPPWIASLSAPKAYELFALMKIMDFLRGLDAGFSFFLAHPPSTAFRLGGGGFDATYQHIEVELNNKLVARIVTDVEFETMSCTRRGSAIGAPAKRYNIHELDVLVISPDVPSGHFPRHDQIYIGVEVKYRPYQKALLRELLGYRRELALFDPGKTKLAINRHQFSVFERTPSGAKHIKTQSGTHNLLMSFCSDNNITKYALPADDYGIVMRHLAFTP